MGGRRRGGRDSKGTTAPDTVFKTDEALGLRVGGKKGGFGRGRVLEEDARLTPSRTI